VGYVLAPVPWVDFAGELCAHDPIIPLRFSLTNGKSIDYNVAVSVRVDPSSPLVGKESAAEARSKKEFMMQILKPQTPAMAWRLYVHPPTICPKLGTS
jgi:hypothetical protein